MESNQLNSPQSFKKGQGEDTKKNVTPIKLNPDFSDLNNPDLFQAIVEPSKPKGNE